jgi:sulfur carrier protein
MRILVNGKPIDVEREKPVSEVIHTCGVPADRTGVAVALNEIVIPRIQWDTKMVHEGDRIEIVHAVQGG